MKSDTYMVVFKVKHVPLDPDVWKEAISFILHEK